MYSKDEVIKANIALHSALAGKYKETEPHYKQENIERVTRILENLQKKAKGKSLLDIGCGMGFIIDIAKSYFKVIRGIDVTPAMLEKVDTKNDKCDIKVMLAESDKLSFDDNSFDVCTAYAVLHHMDELLPTFREIYRVLNKDGIFYSDLDPNYYFWEAISALPYDNQYSDIVKREIDAVLNKDKELEKQFNIERNLLRTAEHFKHEEGGFKEECLRELLIQAGFKNIDIQYEWFLGEGKIIHGKNEEAALIIRDYLHDALPLTKHLFKYVMIFARK